MNKITLVQFLYNATVRDPAPSEPNTLIADIFISQIGSIVEMYQWYINQLRKCEVIFIQKL